MLVLDDLRVDVFSFNLDLSVDSRDLTGNICIEGFQQSKYIINDILCLGLDLKQVLCHLRGVLVGT